MEYPIYQRDLIKLFGKPNYQEWAQEWVVWIDLSAFINDLSKVKQFHYKGKFGFFGNKIIEMPMITVLEELKEKDILQEIKTFGGCFNIRPMKGRVIPSVHSFALAVDFNADKNPFGWDGYDWSPTFAEIWTKHGWEWGYIWDKPVDSMHFQWCWTRNWTEWEGQFVPQIGETK